MNGLFPKIVVAKGDITNVAVDVVVNSANTSLFGGGGVSGAILKAAGLTVHTECRKIISEHGYFKAGEAVITSAGNLPAQYIIHTFGPVWNGGEHGEPEKLALCYKNSLQLAIENDCKTIAFPNISTGIYRFPKKETAKIAIETVVDFLSSNNTIEKVVFMCYDDENFECLSSQPSLIASV
jgi:O-acetyl-ADP-ribose deacetylase